MDQIKGLLAQLGTRNLAIMGGVAALLMVALAAVALRGEDSSMAYLYTDLDPAGAAAISEKLRAENVPFELSADGTAIMAPADRLAELRMAMAGERLGGKIGYEVLDAEQPFGVSASRAKMNETRAVEGELARSIESLDAVTRARIHIVMPERAMFAAESRPATASVTLKTKGRLPGETVQAIRHLVASAVPDLAPEAVSIVDQTGALLARAGDSGVGGAGDADSRQAQVEGKLREQVVALLEPIVGEGKVRAEVSAAIDRDTTREESNVYDPDKAVIARQVTVENDDQNKETSAADTVSVGNQLPEAQDQPATPGDSREAARKEVSEDTTYANSSTRSVVTRAPGRITRLNVAVMVDGGQKGLPAPQVERLTRLVETAVGMDAERGDTVVVESMAFTPEAAMTDATESWMDFFNADQLMGLLKLALVAVVGLVALAMLRSRLAPAPAAGLPALSATEAQAEMLALAEQAADGDPEALKLLEARQAQDGVPLLDHEVALAQVDGRVKASALKRVGDMVATSPPEATAVVRQWLNA